MTSKYEPVVDMTFGQLYDAVSNGEKFYLDGFEIVIQMTCLVTEDAMQCEVYEGLVNNQITRLVKDGCKYEAGQVIHSKQFGLTTPCEIIHVHEVEPNEYVLMLCVDNDYFTCVYEEEMQVVN